MMTEVTTFSRFIWGQLFKMGCFGSFFVWFEYKQMQWCVQRNMVCKWLLLKWLVLSTYFLNQQVKASYACQWAFLAPTYPREFWLGCSDYETHRQNRLQVSVVFFSLLIPCFGFVQSKAFNQRANQIGNILAQIKDPQEGINSPRFCGHISFASSLCPCSHQAKEAREASDFGWKRWLTWPWYQLWVALGVWLIVIGWWFCQDRSCIYILNPLTSRQYKLSNSYLDRWYNLLENALASDVCQTKMFADKNQWIPMDSPPPPAQWWSVHDLFGHISGFGL